MTRIPLVLGMMIVVLTISFGDDKSGLIAAEKRIAEKIQHLYDVPTDTTSRPTSALRFFASWQKR